MDSISPDPPMKQCSNPTCQKWLPATPDYFYRKKRRNGKYGLDSRCKDCVDLKAKQYRQENLERGQQYYKQYYQEHKERYHKQQREYRNAQHQSLLEAKHRYWYEHAEENRRKVREYGRTHRMLKSAHNRNRESLKKTSGMHTAQDIQDQLKRQKGKCYWCNVKLTKYHVDHVVPLSRGGTNDLSNLVIACPFCNLSKHDKLPHEWPRGNRLL